jgi:hypothetical protein
MALVTFGASQPSAKPSIVSNESGFFGDVTCSAAGNIIVKGTNIIEHLAAGATGVGHIDPATGVAFPGNVTTAGYYEALPATAVTIAMVAGDTIRGCFTEIATGTGFKGWGHVSIVHNTVFA